MRLHGGMRLRSFSRLFRARPKDVKWSNIYSLGSHTATRNSAHCFSVFFFFVKCWNAIVCVFCTPLRWKPYLSHIPEDSNSRFFWENAKKNEKNKNKKKNEKSTKSTYTIVSAICDCPPEVRRKRSMRNRILPTCSPLRLDCSYAFAVVVCVAAEYARWTNIYQTGFPKQCLPNRIIFLQHFRRVGHPISLPLLHQGLIIPMVQVILEGHR